MGRTILVIAAVLLVVGLLVLGLAKLTGGRWLPGDIVFSSDRVKVFIPIVTSIVLSIILTVVLNLVAWLMRRGH